MQSISIQYESCIIQKEKIYPVYIKNILLYSVLRLLSSND